ncbi:GntR family transcriptional regulator [Desulfoferula mesophila]|uniref:GntR family transcriptional regulator n=1 Tax=Desulfoferula mesophila TaxID=3058419 RepID=A0AAU9E8I5_9BACT|nr:GntR family transcriptional regulator [Desulfoferula mesophilus]
MQHMEDEILAAVKTPPSLREMAFEAIKEGIMGNTLKSGHTYSEHSLAKQLGMSKTPVHEALLDLALRGFVTLLPRKGVVIKTLTIDEIKDLYDFRLVLEVAVMRKVAGHISPPQIERLWAIHNACVAATEIDDHVGYIKNDRIYHSYMASLAGNSYLVEALENVRDLIDWMGVRAMVRPGRLPEVDIEHALVIEKLAGNNAEEAAKAMEAHVRATEHNSLSWCDRP